MDECPGTSNIENQQSDSFNSISNGVLDIEDKSNVVTVTAYTARGEDEPVQISFTGGMEFIGEGGSGEVYKTKLHDSGEIVAIKKLKKQLHVPPLDETNWDKAKVCAKNIVEFSREWKILRELEHCNIAKLKWSFLPDSGKHLHFVLEYMPQSLQKLIEHDRELGKMMNISLIRVFMYQLFRGLAYIHSLGIAHRSIKPDNILVDSNSGVLKLCDFGNSKYLQSGECNNSQVCSLAYRAPELVLHTYVGVCNYTTKIDLWSAGCILAELLLGRQIFHKACSEFDLFCEILAILGLPTKEDFIEMNPESSEFSQDSEELKLPVNKAYPDWTVLSTSATRSPEAVDLVSCLLVYSPSTRISPLRACTHHFFDELRNPNSRLPNGCNLPPLFNFTEHELNIEPEFTSILSPLQ